MKSERIDLIELKFLKDGWVGSVGLFVNGEKALVLPHVRARNGYLKDAFRLSSDAWEQPVLRIWHKGAWAKYLLTPATRDMLATALRAPAAPGPVAFRLRREVEDEEDDEDGSLRKQVERLREDRRRLHARVQALGSDLRKREKENSALRERNKRLDAQCRDLYAETWQIQGEVDTLRDQRDALLKERDELRTDRDEELPGPLNDKIKALIERRVASDNRATANPVWLVQERRFRPAVAGQPGCFCDLDSYAEDYSDVEIHGSDAVEAEGYGPDRNEWTANTAPVLGVMVWETADFGHHITEQSALGHAERLKRRGVEVRTYVACLSDEAGALFDALEQGASHD